MIPSSCRACRRVQEYLSLLIMFTPVRSTAAHTHSNTKMIRKSVLALLPRCSLFGVGLTKKTPQQNEAREKYKSVSVDRAFPQIAAQWVGDPYRNNLTNPKHVTCLSTKLFEWRCQSCNQTFSEAVCRHIDRFGECPCCGVVPVKAPSKSGKKEQSQSKPPAKPHSSTSDSGSSTFKSKLSRQSNYERAYDVSPSLRSRSISPMLAREWQDCIATTDMRNERLFASPKLDGMRCLVAFSSEANRVMYISRKGSLFECCESLDEHLLPLFKKDPSLMLDGELYTPLVTFEGLSSLVRTTRKGQTDEMKERQRALQFHAFDVMYSKRIANPKNTWFEARYKLLQELIPVKSLRKTSLIPHTSQLFTPVLHVPASVMKYSHADAFLEKAIDNGYEGIMIRRDGFPYGFGTRTNALMKYKKFDTAEYIVDDVLEGVGRCHGQAGALVCRTSNGVCFHATPKADSALRTSLWEEKNKIIGKAVTVQFQGLSPDKIPRFPVALSIRGSADGSDWF